MEIGNPKSTAKIAGHPLHPMIIPFPIAFFVAAFACDVAFSRTGHSAWPTASLWLIGAGLVMAAVAALAGLTDFLGSRQIRALRPAWLHMIGNVIAVVLELINFLLRYRNGTAAVPPTGIVLPGIAVLILLFTGWMGWEMVYRHRVGIAD
jgi:uncharacterized membrane protein